MKTPAYIAVGDIHGCPEQLAEILRLIQPWPEHRLVFLGDYMDRGPDAEAVIGQLRKLDAIFLMGNHEEVFLRRWTKAERDERLQLLQFTGLSISSVDWLLASLQEYHETPDWLFVHAGFDSSKALDEQSRTDLLFTLRTEDYADFTHKAVIHGHHVVERPEIRGNRININTGCGAAGVLTALVLPEMQFVSSSASPGRPVDWARVRQSLQEIEDLELGVLEEL